VRRWLVALAAVVVALGLGLALAARNLDAYLNANREALARQVADALGREVGFGAVGVSLRRGLAVRVADLRIGDDPAFSSEPFLAVEALEVRVAILPALRGRIEVERVLLRRPTISVIETAQGLSTASLGRSAAPPAAAGAPPEASAPGALVVALVDIEDGTLRYLDRTSQPPVLTVAGDLDFQASDLAPDAPVRFEMEAAVLGASRQNLRASGSVGPPGAAEPEIDVAATLDPLDLAQAFASAPLAGRVPAALAGSGTARVELRVKGRPADLAIETRIDAGEAELRFGDGFRKPRGSPLSLALPAQRRGDDVEIGPGDLVVDATRLALRGALEDLASPRLRLRIGSESAFPASFGLGGDGDVLRDLALEGTLTLPSGGPRLTAVLRSASGSLRGLDYRDLALDARLRDRRLEVSQLALAAHQGTLAASGSANLGASGGPAFEARLAVDGVRLESLLAAYAPSDAARASGSLTARLALRGAGASRDAILRSLAGGGELGATDGVLRGFNPAGDALRALSGLPIFADRKIARLFESHPQVFGAEDTPFERIEARLEVASGQVVARDARLVARDYDVTGRGRYEIGGRLDSSAVMAFSPELSDAAVDAEKRLRFLRSPEGRIEFPVVIRGAPDDLAVQPDLAYVASSASREALTGVVERVLIGKRREDAEPAREPGQEPDAGEQPPASLEDAGREILRRGLGGLLGPKE
jgi:AsmA protein